MRFWGVSILIAGLLACAACGPAGSASDGTTTGTTTGSTTGSTEGSTGDSTVTISDSTGAETGQGSGQERTKPPGGYNGGGDTAGGDDGGGDNRGGDAGPGDAQTTACEARGGRMIPVCLDQAMMCVSPMADAGRPCDDGDDCVGDCHATRNVEEGDRVEGRCQATDYPCGCRVNVENGRSEGTFCID